jgi:hypothetical protein
MALAALFAFPSGSWTLIPESHTATTFLNIPWETWGPRWLRSRVQVRLVPGQLAEHRAAPNRGAGLMWPYLRIASRFSLTVSFMFQ